VVFLFSFGGPHITAAEIHQVYAAGATCILPGQFSDTHVDALRQFCSKCIKDDEPANTVVGITSGLRDSSEKAVRNARLALFLWTGGISTALWLCGLQLVISDAADLTPLPLYAALASAGISLKWRRAG